MESRFACVLCLLAFFALSGRLVPAGDQQRSRREFVDAINKVQKGMSRAQVIALLGKPDDIRTQEDRGGVESNGVQEIWRYGTSGHLTTATLGQICIHEVGRVQYVIGQGSPPPEGLFTESELRLLLDALGAVPSFFRGSEFNPLLVIRAVNLLRPLGKEKALAAIEEFSRIATVWCRSEERADGAFLVLATLFDVPTQPTIGPWGETVPAGHMPTLPAGMPSPDCEPTDKTLLPRFPLTIEGDIPFLLVRGYSLFGAPPDPAGMLRYFRKYGTIRAQPLAPTTRPFAAIETFIKSPRCVFPDRDKPLSEVRTLLGEQALRLLETVDQVEPDQSGRRFSWWNEKEANKRIKEASALSIRWDASQNRFTFPDGSSHPILDPNPYGRRRWLVTADDTKIELTLERVSRHYVELRIGGKHTEQTASLNGRLKLINSNPTVRTDFDEQLPELGAYWAGIAIEEGEEVQAVLTFGNETWRSPVMKP